MSRERIFEQFAVDTSISNEGAFTIDANLEVKENSNDKYSKFRELVSDPYLTGVVNNSDEQTFIEYLQKTNCLPKRIVFFSDIEEKNVPGIQRLCHNSWCTQTHYMVYAEAGVAILVVAAATSVTLAAATSVTDSKDELNLSIDLADIMGGKDFSEKVNRFILSWIEDSAKSSKESGIEYC
ncbi:hypothetical protein [Enterococcus gilvus]|uniref:hypothetical protein n=1 Tax=Enterococcus gilvus TaxID=160453 RepID=UPI003ED8D7A0